MATPTVKAVENATEKFFFFWKSKSPFSQWHKADFVVDDVEFNCAEQYMMYRKASELICYNGRQYMMSSLAWVLFI